MKKLLLILVLGTSYASWSQCETNVAANDTTICIGDTVTMTASGPATTLATTFAAGNNHRGNMFDIVALNEVTIESFDAHPQANTDIEIYYKVGGYAGSQANAAAWTLVGTALGVVAQPQGTATPIPISVGVTIPAGQTYAFYVTSSNVAVSLNYTDGANAGGVFSSDANIQFLEGAGMEYPFTNGGGTFTPRIWNGNIHYSVIPATTFSWSNGATTSEIMDSPVVQTTYYVDITSSGCPTVADSIIIYMNPEPIVSLGADTTACPGTQITLDAGPGMASYDWNSGVATTQTVSVIGGVVYGVEVTNAEGCTATDTISVGIGAVPIVSLGIDTTICEGVTVTLDAGNAGSSFDWNTAEVTQTIDVGAGSYDVVVTNTDGCSDSSNIVISENPAPAVNLGADLTFCVNESAVLDAGSGFSGYVWSTTETTQSVTADGATLGVGAHTFTITVTDSLGCTNTDDMIVNVDGCVGLNEIVAKHMKVYPNPTSNVLYVELDQLTSESILNVYAMDGSLVLSERMKSQSQSIDLSRLERGSYILELNANDYKEIIKVIKN